MSMLHFLKSRLPSMVIAELLEKGKRAQIGEVRDWDGQKWRKVSEKKWMPVRDAHKTGEFHGDEHEDIKRVHEASGYRDTKGSTVAGLRYMINREGSTATVRVVHSASGKVLAEGYAGSYGTTNHIYDHLNHVLGSFNWKQSMDNLRTEIGKNDAMRESVKHVLENTDKWKSAKTAVGLKGAGKVSKHAPKKYLAVSKTESTPKAEEKVAEKEPEPVAEKKVDEVVKAEPKKPVAKKNGKSNEGQEVKDVSKITHLDGAVIEYARKGGKGTFTIKKTKDGLYQTEYKGADGKVDMGKPVDAVGMHAMMRASFGKDLAAQATKVVNGTGESSQGEIEKHLTDELPNDISEWAYRHSGTHSEVTDAEMDSIAEDYARNNLSMARQDAVKKALQRMGFKSTAKNKRGDFQSVFAQYVKKHAVDTLKAGREKANAKAQSEKKVAATEKAKVTTSIKSMLANDNHVVSGTDLETLRSRANDDDTPDHPVMTLLREFDRADLNKLAQVVGLTPGSVTMGHLKDLTVATKEYRSSSDALSDHLDDIKKRYQSISSQDTSTPRMTGL